MTGRTARRRGISLPEVLICVAILAMLMTAVAGAFVASSDAMAANDRQVKAGQTARVAMAVMLRDVRQSDACQVGTAAQQGQPVVTADELQVLGLNGDITRYHYDSAAGQLTVALNGGTARVLAHDVAACSFKSAVQTVGSERLTVQVSVALSIRNGSDTVRLSGSTSPRRSMP